MKRSSIFLVIGFFAATAACSSSVPSDATPTCPTSGSLAPGGYGCDLTFADNAHANMCLSPLHYEGKEVFTVLSGNSLSLDAWEPKGAERSMYLVIMKTQPPLVTGDRAVFGPGGGPVAAVMTLSLNPTVDGMVAFEAKSGLLTVTNVSGSDYTLVADGLQMGPYAPDPTNVLGKGTYTASLSCRINSGN